MSADAPLVSVVVPVRNEVKNIERCVRSVMASAYPRLDVIAVDDHSTDGTAELLRRLAREMPTLRVVVPEALPTGWYGKQWACATGFAASSGDVIAFFDADTWQTPDLMPRAVNAMLDRGADLFTVAGTQELGSFWERLVQPQVFGILATRYGSTEDINRSTRASDKIANGQCIFVTRAAYMALGGHHTVRDKVAEDLALAQLFFVKGKRAIVMLAVDQLHTRMYTSLRELVNGWGKNLYVGGIDAMPAGSVARSLYPLALISPGLAGVVPPSVLMLAFCGVVGRGLFWWSAIATTASLLWWLAVYIRLRLSPLYALLSPLGAAALLFICARSVIRGRTVEWKGREYVMS